MANVFVVSSILSSLSSFSDQRRFAWLLLCWFGRFANGISSGYNSHAPDRPKTENRLLPLVFKNRFAGGEEKTFFSESFASKDFILELGSELLHRPADQIKQTVRGSHIRFASFFIIFLESPRPRLRRVGQFNYVGRPPEGISLRNKKMKRCSSSLSTSRQRGEKGLKNRTHLPVLSLF